MTKVAVSIFGIALACLSLFGFLASFEPGVSVAWKILYVFIFAVAVACAVRPWITGGRKMDEHR